MLIFWGGAALQAIGCGIFAGILYDVLNKYHAFEVPQFLLSLLSPVSSSPASPLCSPASKNSS
jgi:hypothetical protein